MKLAPWQLSGSQEKPFEPTKKSLREYLLNRKCRGFYIARMKNVEFGIVDRDRANFLGLSFTVELLETWGEAVLNIPAQNGGLKYIEKYGSAKAMNDMLCWVFVEGPGSSVVRFICMREEVYEADQNEKQRPLEPEWAPETYDEGTEEGCC